jgi:hypothetical protein
VGIFIYASSLIAKQQTYRFAPNLTLLLLETRRRAQKGLNPEKVLSSISGKVGCCGSETNRDRSTDQTPKLLVWGGNYRNKDHNTGNCLGFES